MKQHFFVDYTPGVNQEIKHQSSQNKIASQTLHFG